MQHEVLITGAGGFVGKNLQKYLEEKSIPVKAVSVRNRSLTPGDLSFAVVHLAGKAHDLKKTSNPQEYYDINTELTKKIFDAFLLSDAEVFILLSSVKAVADTVTGIVEETAIPAPVTDYGKSKLLAEQYLLASAIPGNKRVYILRPCMIHGPDNKGNLNLLFKIAALGLPYPLAAFHNQRSFLSIDNLCFVIEELVERKDIPGGIYHVSDDQPVSTKRLMELFSEVLSQKQRFLHISPGVIKWIAGMGDVLHLPLNTERLNKLTENYVVSNTKLLGAIGKKLPISAEEGLRKTIRSFKEKAGNTAGKN